MGGMLCASGRLFAWVAGVVAVIGAQLTEKQSELFIQHMIVMSDVP